MQPLIIWVLLGTITSEAAWKSKAWGNPVSTVIGGKETFFEEAKNTGEFGNNRMAGFVNHREFEGRRNRDINQEKGTTEHYVDQRRGK